MNITTGTLAIAGFQKECNRITISGTLKATEAAALRNEIAVSASNATVYVDVKKVEEIDLSGVNELINCHYLLQQLSGQLIVVYQKNSPVEKWLATTGIGRFISTAVVPA